MKHNASPGNFSFVPAAVFYPSAGGSGIYIRYKRPTNNPIRIKKHNSIGYTLIECPDRDLLFVANQNAAMPYYPSEGTFDEYLDMSPFNGRTGKEYGLDYFMINYLHSMEKKNGSSEIRQHTQSDGLNSPYIISDSGGFQLLKGLYDFIDPVELVKWYNKNVDIGVILDIPPALADEKTVMKLAEIQARNTELMVQHKKPELKLMNVFQGNTLEQRMAVRKIVERPDIDRMAIGGTYIDTVFSSINNILHLMLKGQKYKQYHIFGVSNFIQVVLLIKMAQNGFAENITSDSSTALQKAIKKLYFHQPTVYSNPRYIDIGDRFNFPSNTNILPCACPICSRVKYLDVFSTIDGSEGVKQALTMHNIIRFNDYVQTMKDVFREASAKEARDIVRKQLDSRGAIKEALDCLDFLDSVKEHGLKESGRQYSYYITQYVHSVSGLFKEEQEEGEEAVESEEDRTTRMTLLMNRYSENADVKQITIAGSGVVKKKKKKGAPKQKKTKISRVSASAKPKSKKR